MKTKFSDLFSGDVEEGLKVILATMKDIVKEQEKLAKTKSKSIASSTPKDVASLKKLEKGLSDVNALVKENEKIKKDQITLNARLQAQRTQEAQGLANTREQLNQNNRALRNNARRRNEAIGSLNRMRATLTEARRRWDGLSASERNNTAIGGRLNKVIQKTDAEIRKLEKSTGRAQRNVGNYGSALDKVRGALGSVAAAAGITFGISALGSQITEAITLGAQLEGVKAAFDRLNDPELLRELQTATKGTVSDLELMKQAVQAKNLGVPIQQLGTFFEFARRRAKETGESVEFLTQSIVTGIGRKSPLILDNLGISATALRDRIKETGDFGEAAALIIQEELGNMGDDIDTSAEKTARLGTTWDNLKTSIGGVLAEPVGNFFQGIADSIEATRTGIQRGSFFLSNEQQQELAKLEFILDESVTNLVENFDKGRASVDDFQKTIVLWRNEALKADRTTREGILTFQFYADAVERVEAALKNLNETAGDGTDSLEPTLRQLRETVTALKSELEDSVPATKEFIKLQKDIKEAEDAVTIALGKETEAQKKARIEREKATKAFEKENAANLKLFLSLQKQDDERRARSEQAEIDLAELIATTERARIDAVNLQRDKDLEDLNLTENERILITSQSLKDIDDIEQEFRDKKKADADKDILDAKEQRKKEVEAAKQLFDEVAGLQKDASNKRIKNIDEDIKANEDRITRLSNLANQQSEDVKENLAFERQQQAELRRDREREIQRQKQIEFGLAALQTFSAKTQAGDSNPLVSTIRDLTLLTAFIRSVPSFLEGTDNTGKGGSLDSKGGMSAVLHPNEMVFTSDETNAMGQRSRKEVVNIVKDYDKGIRIAETPSINVQRFDSNDAILERFDRLEKAVVNNKPVKEKEKYEFDPVEGVMHYIVEGNNRKQTYSKKIFLG